VSDKAPESAVDAVVVRHEVHIVGISLPFWETVFLILQLAVAAVPVIVVFGILSYVAAPLVLMFFSGLAQG